MSTTISLLRTRTLTPGAKDVTGAARETMRRIVDQLETVENPPESIRQKLMELALELHTVNGKKQYGYLKKPLKDKVYEPILPTAA